MPKQFSLITGASGLLGSYIAELLVDGGNPVRTVVRPTSDARLLEKLGITVLRGDLTDNRFVRDSVAGAQVVYHCGGQTGNWGRWEKFERGNITATRNVVDACDKHDVSRLLHVSSIAAYGHPPHGEERITEDQPLGQRLWSFDHYNRSKIEAEKIVQQLGAQATIVRPTWFYGPRDRAFLPRVLRALRKEGVWLIGSGQNLLNGVYVSDVAEGTVLAGEHPEAGGESYNLCNETGITQQEFFDILCDATQLPRVRRRIPLLVAHNFAHCCEIVGRLARRNDAPALTRHALSVLSRPARFSNAKARTQLGWEIKVSYPEGLSRTLAWLNRGEASGQNKNTSGRH